MINTLTSEKIRMSGKTSSDSTHLCLTCTYGQVIKFSNNEEQTFCFRGGDKLKILSNVVQCTDYYNRGLPSIRSLYETAFIITTDPKKNTIGFKPYKQWKEEDGKEEYEY